MMMRRLGLAARAVALVIATLAIAGVAGWLLIGTASDTSAALLALLLALLGGGLLARLWFAPPMEAARAVADGLQSYVERDYGMRLAGGLADDPAGLVRRFNQLGEQLRSTHDDAYQKEMLLRTVLAATPTAIVLENEAGCIVYANTTACELFYDGKPLEGCRFAEVISGLAPELREATKGREDVLFSVEHEGEPQVYDVARRYFHIDTQPHKLWMVRPLGRDLERREAEAWKKAIRVMSHEINNSLAPIVSLVNSARTLLEVPGGSARLGIVFDTIAERAEHLRAFLDGFARVSRLPRPQVTEVQWQGFFTAIHHLAAGSRAGAHATRRRLPDHARGRHFPAARHQHLDVPEPGRTRHRRLRVGRQPAGEPLRVRRHDGPLRSGRQARPLGKSRGGIT